jgi:hypothetical protein
MGHARHARVRLAPEVLAYEALHLELLATSEWGLKLRANGALSYKRVGHARHVRVRLEPEVLAYEALSS